MCGPSLWIAHVLAGKPKVHGCDCEVASAKRLLRFASCGALARPPPREPGTGGRTRSAVAENAGRETARPGGEHFVVIDEGVLAERAAGGRAGDRHLTHRGCITRFPDRVGCPPLGERAAQRLAASPSRGAGPAPVRATIAQSPRRAMAVSPFRRLNLYEFANGRAVGVCGLHALADVGSAGAHGLRQSEGVEKPASRAPSACASGARGTRGSGLYRGSAGAVALPEEDLVVDEVIWSPAAGSRLRRISTKRRPGCERRLVAAARGVEGPLNVAVLRVGAIVGTGRAGRTRSSRQGRYRQFSL